MTKHLSENSVTNRSYWNSVWSEDLPGPTTLNEDDFHAGRNGLFIKLIQRHLGDIRRKSVVEFGGGGNNTRLLALAKWLQADVTALDFSEEGLRVVARLFESNQCNAHFVSADLTSWVPEDRFDFVVHWGVLEHFIDPRPLLAKSAAALAPGGALMFSMPNMEALAAGLWKRWSPNNWANHILHTDDLIVHTLSELGLADVRAFHFGIPAVKMDNWERRTPVQYPFDLLQKLGSASARLLPVFHRWGHRSLSMERGFFARRGH